ncbi:glycosyltransferase [Candidatus Uhrbacteria bacterium]|nr:glycosyltransferase [Candidatus Uhrbacteria bacterium]MBD3283909.1 glycosyltransferase [Candidatus Uhrbacteria bacterium]
MNRDVTHQPLVSVVIPSWNHGEELISCLMSLEAQTYRPFEVVVVDDASTDDTQDRLKHIRVSYPLRSIQMEENRGAAVARNLGARRCEGAYLLFVDADAELRPHMIERMVRELQQRTGVDFIYSSFRFGWKPFKSRSFDAKALRRMPYIHTTSLLRRSAFPGFDESLKKFQDWDLWLTMSERGSKGYWIPEELFTLKVRREGMSRWLPSVVHKLPWQLIGWMPRELRNYRKWEKVVKDKHGIVG